MKFLASLIFLLMFKIEFWVISLALYLTYWKNFHIAMKYKKNSMEKRFTNLEWQGQVCMQIHPDATILRRVFATGLVGHRPWPSRYRKRLGSRCTCCVGFGFQNELKRSKHSNETFYLNSTKNTKLGKYLLH